MLTYGAPFRCLLTARQTLRHVFHHGTHRYPDLALRLDIPEDAVVRVEGEDGLTVQPNPKIRARSQPISIQRLADRSPARIDKLLDTGREKGSPVILDASAWVVDELPGPNITDKESVLGFARIASNAYILDHDDPEWSPVGGSFNYTDDFGWDDDGLRGHIFADENNMTVIIGIKGTSPGTCRPDMELGCLRTFV